MEMEEEEKLISALDIVLKHQITIALEQIFKDAYDYPSGKELLQHFYDEVERLRREHNEQ